MLLWLNMQNSYVLKNIIKLPRTVEDIIIVHGELNLEWDVQNAHLDVICYKPLVICGHVYLTSRPQIDLYKNIVHYAQCLHF